MTDRFSGLAAVVTGGASGIGAATARRLAAEGAVVTVADLREDAAKELAAEIGGAAVRMDVTDDASVREAMAAAVAATGRLDVLVNNAGGDRVAFFAATTPADWDTVLRLNLRSALLCTHAALPHLRVRGGAVVNVASEAGRVGTVGGVAYSAAKAGVLGFTRAIAREFAAYGIRCNAVAPGPIETPLLADLGASGRLGAALRRAMVDATVLGRAGTAAEVAAGVAFLASADASYLTGHTLAVSGGVVMT